MPMSRRAENGLKSTPREQCRARAPPGRGVDTEIVSALISRGERSALRERSHVAYQSFKKPVGFKQGSSWLVKGKCKWMCALNISILELKQHLDF